MVNSNDRNVLLVNMSTLNNPVRNFYYRRDEAKNGIYFFDGISSLEPGTKYVISMLAESGISIDNIVVTCTPETLKIDERHRNYPSAYLYYKYRINRFIGCKKKAFSILEDDMEKTIDKEVVEEARKEMIKITLDVVKDEEDNIERDFYRFQSEEKIIKQNDKMIDVTDKIKELYKDREDGLITCLDIGDILSESPKKLNVIEAIYKRIINDHKGTVNIYLDIQGGDRSFVYILNSMMAMRDVSNVNVKYAVSSRYIPKENLHPINDSTEAFKLVDLVTAVRAFTNYGRGDLLTEYYHDAAEESNEKKVSKAIREVSDAIQINSPVDLMKAIRDLSELMKDERGIQDPYLRFVFDDIRNDYGDVLNPINEEDSYSVEKRKLSIIHWCSKKGFVQQALTLIEDEMPEFFLLDKVIPIPYNNEELVRNYGDYYQATPNILFYRVFTEISKKENKEYTDRFHKMASEFLFKKLAEEHWEDLKQNEWVRDVVCCHLIKTYAIDFRIDLMIKSLLVWGDGESDKILKFFLGESLNRGTDLDVITEKIKEKFEGYGFPKDNNRAFKYRYFIDKAESLNSKLKKDQFFFNDFIYKIAEEQKEEFKSVRKYIMEGLINGNSDVSIKKDTGENGIYTEEILKNDYIKWGENEFSRQLNKKTEEISSVLSIMDGIVDEEGNPRDPDSIKDRLIRIWLNNNENKLCKYEEAKEKYAATRDKIETLYKKIVTNHKEQNKVDLVKSYIEFRDLVDKESMIKIRTEIDYINILRLFEDDMLNAIDNSGEEGDAYRYGLVGDGKTLASLKINKEYKIGKKNELLITIPDIECVLKQRRVTLAEILNLHRALKMERNNTNHAAESKFRLPVSIIKELINCYVELCKENIVKVIDEIS